MGEAKRRRDYERAHGEEIAVDLTLRRERGALIEEVGSWDPEDLDPRIGERLQELDELLRIRGS